MGGDLKKLGKRVTRALDFTPLTGFGAVSSAFRHGASGNPFSIAASQLGFRTPALKGEIQDAENKARADAEAAYRQALFEASKQEGLSRLALRRRRGFAASMIVDPGTTQFGSSANLGS